MESKLIPYEQAIIVGGEGEAVVFAFTGERHPASVVVLTGVKCRECGKNLGAVGAMVPEPDLCSECFERWIRCK